MDVTKANFSSVLPQITDAINAADFLAFDLEFTGLTMGPQFTNHPVDMLEERYQKLKTNASSFTISQFGLSAFKWDAEANRHVARTWNIYLFPRTHRWCDRRFSCQASSIEFLTEHHFDFNKFIYQGVGYLNRFVEGKMRPQLEEEIKKMQEDSQEMMADIVPTMPRDIEFLDGFKASLDEWLKQGAAEPLVIVVDNSFLRRLVYQEIRNSYSGLHAEKVPGSWDKINISRMSQEEVAKCKLELIQQKKDELEEAIGFRRVWDAIINSRKPIIGHNLLLDLFYSYFQFEGNLPSDVRKFKAAITQIFPLIFDTKHIAANDPAFKDHLTSTALGNVYDALKAEAKVVHGEGFDRYRESDEFAHEAGFDAFMTGTVFSVLLEKIVGPDALSAPLIMHEKILKYANSLNQYGWFSSFRLDRTKEDNNFSNVFHLSFTDSTIQTGDILSLFDDIPVQVKWINGTSVWVLVDASLVSRVMSVFNKQLRVPRFKGKGFQLQTFDAFKSGKPVVSWSHLGKALATLFVPMALAVALHHISAARTQLQ